MPYQGIEDMYFMQKRDLLLCAGYTILGSFVYPMRFIKKLLEKDRLSVKYERTSLHTFMEWVHSALPRREALNVGANRTH